MPAWSDPWRMKGAIWPNSKADPGPDWFNNKDFRRLGLVAGAQMSVRRLAGVEGRKYEFSSVSKTEGRAHGRYPHIDSSSIRVRRVACPETTVTAASGGNDGGAAAH